MSPTRAGAPAASSFPHRDASAFTSSSSTRATVSRDTITCASRAASDLRGLLISRITRTWPARASRRLIPGHAPQVHLKLSRAWWARESGFALFRSRAATARRLSVSGVPPERESGRRGRRRLPWKAKVAARGKALYENTPLGAGRGQSCGALATASRRASGVAPFVCRGGRSMRGRGGSLSKPYSRTAPSRISRHPTSSGTRRRSQRPRRGRPSPRRPGAGRRHGRADARGRGAFSWGSFSWWVARPARGSVLYDRGLRNRHDQLLTAARSSLGAAAPGPPTHFASGRARAARLDGVFEHAHRLSEDASRTTANGAPLRTKASQALAPTRRRKKGRKHTTLRVPLVAASRLASPEPGIAVFGAVP